MQELIDRLVKEAGVTPEQAKQSIESHKQRRGECPNQKIFPKQSPNNCYRG